MSAEEALVEGWKMAEATLATADSERRLVTHCFDVPGDASVNTDDHFGSDERTLRFVGVALPTLLEQLGARGAIVSVPFALEGAAPSLTVIALVPGSAPAVASRALQRGPADSPGPPFWTLGAGVRTPVPLARLAGGLRLNE